MRRPASAGSTVRRRPLSPAHQTVADPAGRAHLLAGQDVFQDLTPVLAQQFALEPLGLVVLPIIDPGGCKGP